MSDLVRVAIVLTLTTATYALVATGIKTENPNVKAAGYVMAGFAAGFMATDAYHLGREMKRSDRE